MILKMHPKTEHPIFLAFFKKILPVGWVPQKGLNFTLQSTSEGWLLMLFAIEDEPQRRTNATEHVKLPNFKTCFVISSISIYQASQNMEMSWASLKLWKGPRGRSLRKEDTRVCSPRDAAQRTREKGCAGGQRKPHMIHTRQLPSTDEAPRLSDHPVQTPVLLFTICTGWG